MKQMNISDYLEQVRAKYDSGQATEHSYRPALQSLFEAIDPTLQVINEPKRSDAGMPDFLFQRGDVPVGWAEAKDIDKDVIKLKGYSIEQRKRYEKAYPNLIYTNGVDFEFIRDSESVHFVSIADFLLGLQPNPDNFDQLVRQLKNFGEQQPISIKSAKKLAELMAAKAAIIKDEIGIALLDDPELRSTLASQFKGFKANLLPNLTTNEFADIYAETITYGMFAARLNDDTLETFSRGEALDLLPKSNPFLRDLFGYIAGPALPDRLRYIVDDLAQVLRASDPHTLFEDFGNLRALKDPFIHFYEDFLREYNPKKRKERGVWYTPEPVVDFIVRAVDDVLKTEFELSRGLADTSKVSIDYDTGLNKKTGKPMTERREVHRVQILDPATGTGTFLAKAVQMIAERVKKTAPGKWTGYVEEDLIPRIHGFELLMASYAMCHMKLDMALRETGYTPSESSSRLSVWLTDSLEEAEREIPDLFFTAMADEARGSSEVKRQKPIMCIIGNPPYLGQSSNKGKYIMDLMKSYKMEPGGKQKLKERNPKWINNDYVKFIRISEETIAQNGEGILAFITSSSYLDSTTFRGMRWHLLKSFDRIFVYDLHGDADDGGIGPNSETDENVFDIKEGVSIIICIKRPPKEANGAKKKGALADFFYKEIWAPRKAKFEALSVDSLADKNWEKLEYCAPQFALVPRSNQRSKSYYSGFSVTDLLQTNSTGILTARDKLTVNFERQIIWQNVKAFAAEDEETLRSKYNLGDDSRDWKVSYAKKDINENFSEDFLSEIDYRLFDRRTTYYTGNNKGFHTNPRYDVMRHMLGSENLALAVCRQCIDENWANVFVSNSIGDDSYVSNRSKERAYFCPLYFYPEEGTLDQSIRVNFDPKIYASIRKGAGLGESNFHWNDEFRGATGDARPDEVKVFDYIYGVLHSPDYRETYKEFLKIDFPRIPYPSSPEVFAHLSEKGESLRRLHLMEDAAISGTPYPFMGEGDDMVVKPVLEDGKVYINKNQYFGAVPKLAWEFHIGGYQPARKWLKDRKGRRLSFDDIVHYQKIIKILCQTDQIMKEIELPLNNFE